MSEITLKELLEIKKNDKKLNKEQQKLYFEATLALLNSENNATPYWNYIINGAALGGAKAFALWCSQFDEVREMQELKQLLHSKEYSSIKPPLRFRLLLLLFSGFLVAESPCADAIKTLVQWLPDTAYGKDGAPFNEVVPYMKAYFFDTVSEGANFPNLNLMNLSDIAIIDFLKLFNFGLSEIEPRKNIDKNKKSRIMDWLAACVPQKREETSELLIATPSYIEQTTSISVAAEKEPRAPIASEEKKLKSKTARKLLALAHEWDAMSESCDQLQAQIAEKEQIIQDINAKLLSTRDALACAKQQTIELKAQIAALTAEHETVKKEKEELPEIKSFK